MTYRESVASVYLVDCLDDIHDKICLSYRNAMSDVVYKKEKSQYKLVINVELFSMRRNERKLGNYH